VGDKENTERVFADESLQIVSQDIFTPGRTLPDREHGHHLGHNSATGN